MPHVDVDDAVNYRAFKGLLQNRIKKRRSDRDSNELNQTKGKASWPNSFRQLSSW
jgi:hypothetical protein